jgi:hypothetical protein
VKRAAARLGFHRQSRHPTRVVVGQGGEARTLIDLLRTDAELMAFLDGSLRDSVAVWERATDHLIDHVRVLYGSWREGVRLSAGEVRYIRHAATSDRPVLLVGETGVGKEELARSIHQTWVASLGGERTADPVPEDVARCITALCHPATYWMTGNTLHVDGGENIVG